MSHIAELFKWLLERDIRAKNATSILFALVVVALFYLFSRTADWFEELNRYGGTGVVVALAIVLLVAYFTAWLVWSAVASWHEKRLSIEQAERERIAANRQAQHDEERRLEAIRNNLHTLTDWQWRFLLRFIIEGRTQIPEFEVGQYRAAWDFEVAVLVEKRIVIEHRCAGVYEIAPAYLEYLNDNWDPRTGTLR